jgi:TraM recognition site of TraD and TraG
LSVANLYKVISSAPQDRNQTMAVEHENGEVVETTWMKTSFCASLIFKAYNREDLSSSQQKDLESVKDYWTIDFAGLNDKTRSIITFSFTGLADVFLRGDLRELFTTTTNIFPEFTHNGAVILLDLPVHEYGKTGQFVQSIFKYVWQKATERRAKTENMTPVFLWADEAQFFINSHDVKFQTTARSSRACTVYLTQMLPSYIGSIGTMTKSLLGNLQTKIFHQNGDEDTNKYASEMIGKGV